MSDDEGDCGSDDDDDDAGGAGFGDEGLPVSEASWWASYFHSTMHEGSMLISDVVK